MEAVSCPRCGDSVPVPEAGASEAGAPLTLTCPGCASRLAVSVFVDGAETLFQPQLMPGSVKPSSRRPAPDPAATVPLGSRTAMLDPETDSDPQEAPATLARAALILAGAEPGDERMTLSEPTTTVGRDGADIVIPDPAMSARHFAVDVRGEEYFVRDLASSNGTFLNGDRIRAAELASGDTIRAGQSSLTFRVFEVISIG